MLLIELLYLLVLNSNMGGLLHEDPTTEPVADYMFAHASHSWSRSTHVLQGGI